MISPTRRAVWLMAAGAPLALILAAAAPHLWTAGLAWVMAVAGVIGMDAWLAPPPRSARPGLEAPATIWALAPPVECLLAVAFDGRAPGAVEAALETNSLLAAAPTRAATAVRDHAARLRFTLAPLRRGEGRIQSAWVRWSGPLGLVTVQARWAFDRVARILPAIETVRGRGLNFLTRDALLGEKGQPEPGVGSEFHALRDFQPGMDLRAIDWKQSARHRRLLAKEFRSERNHPIMLVIDSGRVMGEPVEGAPRLDRAIAAALLLAYASLKLGDRVGLAAFDSRPRLVARTAAGTAAFQSIQRLAAGIDYSSEETNFTFGLTTVAGVLDRRALVVVFTEFGDTLSAQLMLETAGRLARRHLLLFVLFSDAELEAIVRAPPERPADVSRAVIAETLLAERALVVAQLRRLGAEVVEAPAARLGLALLDRYLSLKRRDRL